MEAVGHGSNRDLAEGLRLDIQAAGSPRPYEPAPGYERQRRAWGVTTGAIVSVLSSAGELRSRDIHAAVQAMCDECLCPRSRTASPSHRADRIRCLSGLLAVWW